MSSWRTRLKWGLRALLVLAFLGITLVCWAYVHFIVVNPGAHLERESIHQVISQESPVFYRDGRTPLGVFFAEEHRKYVRYDGIPKDFVAGLVSAEDQDYWEHGGFSLRGIARAFVSNLKAGRVVEGGSTLTQQTAKNLFKRRGRTYREKLRELANALRLERLYDKEDILEFYSNQFYVNGNGRGLAIAARFFFDKELSELDLVECAFLAGVVKSPNRYNPWVPGVDRQQKARAEARGRVDYVLGRMLEDGVIDVDRYEQGMATELSFERGHFRFARSVALDEVERELSRPSFQLLLARHGIGDLGTSGLRITTTLDPTIQRGARYALRHHLSWVGVLLEEPEIGDFFGEPVQLKPVDSDHLGRGFFHRGTLLSVDPEARTARIDLGGVEGVVDAEGNRRLAEGLKRSRGKNNWARASRKNTSSFVESLRPFVGNSVLVSARGLGADGAPLLDWEFDAKVQGGVLVLEEGVVRAMVGGALDTDFNRAVVAKRQFGSIWKPVLFQAALQLRWRPTDKLDNRRAVFPYQGGFYYPRPDHKDAPEHVSMAWAAAKSENLASIWLLHHLLDRLSPEEFVQIATQVDLMPRDEERPRDFRARIHKAGIVPTERKVDEGLFLGAREDVGLDLAFDGFEEEVTALEAMHYGLGFASQVEKVSSKRGIGAEEKELRTSTLRKSFLRQEALASRFAEARAALLERAGAGDEFSREDLQGLAIREGPENRFQLSYGEHLPDGFSLLDPERLTGLLPASPVLAEAAEASTAESSGEAERQSGEMGPADPDESAGSADETVPASGEASPSPAASPTEAPVRARPPTDLKVESRRPAPRRSPLRTRPTLSEKSSPRKVPTAPLEEEVPLSDRRVRALAELLSDKSVVLEGQLRPHTLERVRKKMGERRSVLGPSPGLYEPDFLSLVQDYRVLVGLRYVIELARRSGVSSSVEPVQSLPLGSSDITLLEAARLYEVMLTGNTYQFFPSAEGALASGQEIPVDEEALDPPFDARRATGLPTSQLIARIERADGELIYEGVRDILPVQDSQTSGEVGAMLLQVVKHGTGRRASGAVKPSSNDPRRSERLKALGAVVPFAGKTGTTNAYRNAAFVGMVPGLRPGGEDLTWGAGHVVAVYVGYDDNSEMKRGGIRIAGASGGLPVWIDVARSCVEASGTGDKVDLVDLALTGDSELPLLFPEDFQALPVDRLTGLPVELSVEESEAAEGVMLLPVPPGTGRFVPFQPLPHRARQER